MESSPATPASGGERMRELRLAWVTALHTETREYRVFLGLPPSLATQNARGPVVLALESDEGRIDIPERAAREILERAAARLEDTPDRTPGLGLYGDLLAGPFGSLVEPALAWATSAPNRCLHLVFVCSDPALIDWPIESLTHHLHGVLGAQPWCRLWRSPAPEVEIDTNESRELPARLLERASRACRRGHRMEAIAVLRSALAWATWERQSSVPPARLRSNLARLLADTEQKAEAKELARAAVAEASRTNDTLSERSARRFLAEQAHLEGRAKEAAQLLDECITLAAARSDDEAVALDRTIQVLVLFAAGHDLAAVERAPRARRALRRAGLSVAEAHLDVALGRGASRHGHPRAAVNLLRRGIRRLAAAGRPRDAVAAATHLVFELLHQGRDAEVVGLVVACLVTSFAEPSPSREPVEQFADLFDDSPGGLEGVVLEGLLAPLLNDIAPTLLDHGRPRLLVILGLLMLLAAGIEERGSSWRPVPAPLPLCAAWVGRYVRLIGWLAMASNVNAPDEEERKRTTERLSRRALHLGRTLDGFSGGVLGAVRLLHRLTSSPETG